MTTISTLQPLALRDAVIADGFWAPRRETVRAHTIPQQEHQLRTGGQFEALRLAWRPGDPGEPHIFWESDIGKWIEAASYTLATHPDPDLEASVDEAIDLLRGAQQPDGYLNTYFTVVKPGERFTDLRDAHELYCLGHLIEGAVAHFDATGSTSFLDIVRRYADLVVREFGPGGSCEGGYDGHQEIELALVKLSRATGDARYVELAKRMIDARGTQPYYFEAELERRGTPGYFSREFRNREQQAERFREYNQSHLPVREQSEIVGHSVRAMYMLIAMADLAVDTDDPGLLSACERLWESMVGGKMYVTGGLGSDPSIEGFSAPFDLPNYTGYGETCAAIGLVMWAQRMANITRDGRYADVLERALYNGVLAGASSDGVCYFYGNPLASAGDVHRHEWFGVACCPPNLARLLASLQTYAYAQGDDELAVHLYIGGSVTTTAGGGATVDVATALPADGRVALTFRDVQADAAWTLALRVPAWSATTSVRVNGEEIALAEVVRDGYARLTREWAEGDVVELSFDDAPFRVRADPRVAADAGRVALQRGPLVHCLEGVDLDGVPAHSIVLPREAALVVEEGPVAGVHAIAADARRVEPLADGQLYSTEDPRLQPQWIRAIPYFAWANRGQSTMAVWLPER
ncbi:glycoside hydrolase family 127 protein [Demequina sp. SYSU T00039]|uniref:Glycoside hydrolase family 127 protein n=1 Tax=Demequina lignilytica TaxID=3051663 RepID=A0AAW7M2Z4_9MICO|nr:MULTISPECIES: beta-L-arabinofuranosidase domain-containing protein [unclassified Demequina]MDN4477858.1 glycoside hydrolase family 127 protein [Demequina sp. SYSU T00039-1]MDN4487767.1 glycoside hydrolase family 127 protein [Demequina sp. SYSU T00039]MDN4490850.1 glycoside hydrolase family 127 protein [Demequina sp. SYSU T00068]